MGDEFEKVMAEEMNRQGWKESYSVNKRWDNLRETLLNGAIKVHYVLYNRVC